MTRRKPKVHPQVKAWREWLDSQQGRACMQDAAAGQYLENRLWHAFFAGWKRGKP